MLHKKKLKKFEIVICYCFFVALLGIGIGAVVVSVQKANLVSGFAGGGSILLGLVYLWAARRGRPL